MSQHDIEMFIQSLGNYRPVFFFSGGEPFLRDDFLDILTVVKKYNLKCGINTNAYFLDEDKARKLSDLNVELVIFSLFGPQDIHDRMTGIKGSYARVSKNIKFLCSRKNKNMRVILNCAICEDNIDHLEELPRIARTLGADAVKFEHLNFISLNELKEKKQHFLSDSKAFHTYISDSPGLTTMFSDKIIGKLEDIKNKYGNFVFIKPDLKRDEIASWYSEMFNSERKCFFIWHSIFIRSDATAVPCQFLQEYELGDIREKSLQDIITSSKARCLKKLARETLLRECSRCCKL